MMAWFSGCQARAISSPDGILTWKQISGSPAAERAAQRAHDADHA
jgi:hypothetical protein